MTTKTVQQQIDFIELKIKEVLESPNALSSNDTLTENKVDVSQNPNNIIMTTKTIQQQIDFIEFKIKEELDLIYILKRNYCIHKLPIALSGDDDLKKLIDKNVKVSQNHENALIDIENFKLNDLHHHKLKNISKLA